MTNSVDPDQTAPIGAVCSGSILFASILKFVINVWQLFAADDFSRRHFQMQYFLAPQGQYLNVDKKYVGHDVRKTVFGGLRTSKAQTSLRFRSDLEITQLHQTRPSATVRP